MIPFSSQRGLGQDLATHLLNERDNEMMEVLEIRGAIAQDLHGAFAEWEVHAHAMTRCQNYLYSLSINPDPRQGTLSREQYFEYIDRAEEKLGLAGQPRAIVFHEKHGRAHCHVVWSRIDTDNMKAVHMAFDREKLMMVTREFARDHGLELPAGYERDGERGDRKKQLSLYEQYQQVTTGLTREERMAHITAAWRQSDSPKAFVQALSELGYILASGNRPYVLVDLYGHTNNLPKMIADKHVRTKDIRAYLEKDYPADSLPSIEQAKELAAAHRKASESFFKSQVLEQKIAALKAKQAKRRQKVELRQEVFARRQKRERHLLGEGQARERAAMRSSYLAEAKRIRAERAERQPKGLAGFLGRVTAIALVIKKVQKHQDKKRLHAFLDEKKQLGDQQAGKRKQQSFRHEMQALDIERRVRALDQIDRRELKSLEAELIKEQRMRSRSGRSHMPAIALDPNHPGRLDPDEAQKIHDRELEKLHREFDDETFEEEEEIDLTDEFTRAAGGPTPDGDGGGGDDRGPGPDSGPKLRRRRRRKRDLGRGR